jgi:prepilin-type N-terminal cleavage/methylation domain-containing protein
MRIFLPSRRGSFGFSLLEVLVAVVVLSVGLLALAALQGSLTRSSAEAKVRARVAAMLATRMDTLRNGGYGALAEGSPPPLVSTAADACDDTPGDWLDCAREQAALGNLSLRQTVATWYGSGGFATPAPAPADPNVAQFKRIPLAASWQDATGQNHQLSLVTDLSALGLANNIVIPPEDSSQGRGGPIVRTRDPATAGVVPIAMGPDATSATSNPVPELVGQQNNQKIVGTRFNVLNYTPPVGGAVVIQKRFETEVVKCSCRYGAGASLPAIYRTAQWPAIWTGDRYEVFKPEGNLDPAGAAANAGPKAGVEQNALCQECCRDHHDGTATDVARFDPERGAVSKYEQKPAGLQLASPNGDYVDACRLVRIDGFWRTAADMYARQFGLLETQSDANGVPAKSGLPTTAAVNAYTGFVKDVLDEYDGSNVPANVQGRFDAVAGINDPALIVIPRASSSDYRYLHARALYVDHLEAKARTRLQEVLADTGTRGLCPTGTPIADCVLPYLPFTTINLTEIATWLADPAQPGVITVNSSNLLATTPEQPSGGRTIGIGEGTTRNLSSVRASNSGLAVNTVLTTVAGVDPDDNAVLADAQAFEVRSSAGPAFGVRVAGGGGSPFVYFTLGTDVDVECLKPAGTDHKCVTATGTTLPQPGSIRLSNYWVETTLSRSVTATCGDRTATATIAVPIFRNYEVTAAAIGALAGTIAPPVNDNRTSESTTIAFGAIGAGDRIDVTLAEQVGSPTEATIVSCTTNGGRNQINTIVWNKPWTQP